MLREIINFTRSLSPEAFLRNLLPAEGLHIRITLSESGDLLKYEPAFFRKNDELTPFLQDCLKRQFSTKFVSINKALDSRKKIHSCSPFCVAFKHKTFDEIQGRLDAYFDTALQYCENDEQTKWANILRNFCNDGLIELVNRVREKLEADESTGKKFKLSDNHYIYTYLANVPLETYDRVHQNYLKQKAFNKEEFNVPVNGETFGVSDYLTGYNQKKPFLLHQTATFNINARVSNDDAMRLLKFSQLKENRQLPNPLPIFIDKEELNDEVVKIFNRDGERKIGYAEMIKAVYAQENDLGNYYLLNIQGTTVRDFDFVSSFQFNIEPEIVIENIFPVKSELPEKKISTIFEFERKLVSRIFNGVLVRSSDKGLWLRYFDDIDYKPQYMSAEMYQLVLKYRKAFYDYIYKSKREAITAPMFHDIMQNGILGDVRQDEFTDGKHTKNFTIKEKLNIWFSMFEFFGDQQLQNGERTMANQIRHLQQRVQEIVDGDEAHVETDQEFAFAAGQAIYYLLNCSEASNKSHALLEPFLQKTDLAQFKMAISRTFAQYKHAISFYKGRFEKLMAEVLSFEIETSLKSLLPMILAGYFAGSVMFQKKAVE